jgi:hypothetical protein
MSLAIDLEHPARRKSVASERDAASRRVEG